VLATQRNEGTDSRRYHRHRRSLLQYGGGWGTGTWGATHNNCRGRFWCRTTSRALCPRGLAGQLKVDVETLVLVAAFLGWKARTVFGAVTQPELWARNVVGAVAIGVLNDGESEVALVRAIVRAVAIGLIRPCVWCVLAEPYSDGRAILTNAVFSGVVWRAVFS
jgi:hypothetical protein